MMSRQDSESKIGLYNRIANGLQGQPAYLLVFAVSALFVLTGVVSSSAAVVKGEISFGLLALVSFAVALIAVVVVVREVERNQQSAGYKQAFDSISIDEQNREQLQKDLSHEPLTPVVTPRLGKLPQPLTVEEERRFMAEFTEWTILETRDRAAAQGLRRELYRVYEFPTFDFAWRFMNDVEKFAMRPCNHHPRWQNAYNRVEVWLTTFNLGYRPSTKDVRLAGAMENVWQELQSEFTKQRQAKRASKRK